jgi:galactonate dehydratase
VKITAIDCFPIPPRWLFVRVSTDEGVTGWGEASLEGHTESVVGAFESLKDRMLGFDAFRIEEAWQIGYRGGFYRGGPVLMSALSGLDQALWDIKGKALGQPVWQLLGGQVRNRIEVYSWIGGDKPHEAGEGARARREQGFRAVKMNATAQLSRLASPRELDAVIERVEAVKAEGMDVGLDFHGRVHKAMAKQLVKRLEEHRPLFVEEPLLSEEPEALAELARSTSIPIALGERLFDRWDFKPILAGGCADIVQPDLSHAGGISEVRKIAAMAEAHDVAVAPHCPLGALALASCFQIAACTPNVVLQEMSVGIHYNTGGWDLASYVKDKSVFAVENGFVKVPTGPGLGVEIDEDLVKEASREAPRWRNPIWRNPDGSVAEW